MAEDTLPRAVVADDDALIRLDATDILEDAGFRSHEACNVEDAIAILEEIGGDVSVLFTDVQMPPSTRDGFELARICAERWPHISIIVASGQAEPQHGDLPDGARFVSKPFTPAVIYRQLSDILPAELARLVADHSTT